MHIQLPALSPFLSLPKVFLLEPSPVFVSFLSPRKRVQLDDYQARLFPLAAENEQGLTNHRNTWTFQQDFNDRECFVGETANIFKLENKEHAVICENLAIAKSPSLQGKADKIENGK